MLYGTSPAAPGSPREVGNTTTFILSSFCRSSLYKLEPAPEVNPGRDSSSEFHPVRAARRAPEQRRRRMLARPESPARSAPASMMPAVDGVEHLEGGHHRARRLQIHLESAARHLRRSCPPAPSGSPGGNRRRASCSCIFHCVRAGVCAEAGVARAATSASREAMATTSRGMVMTAPPCEGDRLGSCPRPAEARTLLYLRPATAAARRRWHGARPRHRRAHGHDLATGGSVEIPRAVHTLHESNPDAVLAALREFLGF